ncbi:MAG: HpcH/HpaI aldolase family protein [Bosea sp. (in: a-proteobacteria)]|uniref:HpcH/HpaI aldolase family protein n=1 Tax=unclassified Bosea (in: a-proteobacteria) TaxID=2653178 RepID=UPI0009677BFC|nr:MULTISPECIES: aldolase/citrate lyase family protein [unclassified Bosea (in: a-proteobacteria)]MBN9443488.1 4-hydroxy-2-oxo-heptane-1,7-dioate aldolase [Bosea sp. (in: a-proteobacteria)]MBN9458969.1 4-hydroxy-2-oxo-heptane-1,7-dioate aldolase [Bosea sp. (in: a-proteobacteria)]OJV06283.1 MAG: 4-hydroxy-2-oxo-heptane-1,7-dioate aldolase [Bosea sp. 67-29]
MNLPSNKFLASIRAGRQQIGLWLSLASGYATEAVAGAGFDWLLIDTEHSPNDLSSVMMQLQVLAAHPGTPIVRPDWNDTVLVKRLLDIGAPGLLFPMVQTPEEAAQAVAATRYPPRGVRGVSGCNRANGFARMTDYFSRIEEETAVLVQVETLTAIEQALEIGRVDGVDGVFFGPSDIAADMGMLGKPNDPAVWDVIRPAARKLMEAGIPVGTLVFDPRLARNLLAEGFAFVACGSDAVILARGADSLLATMKG